MFSTSKYFGAVFKNRGRGPKEYDCLGLFLSVFKDFGVEIPDYGLSCRAVRQISALIKTMDSKGDNWKRLQAPVAPCAVCLKNHPEFPHLVNHVGVYVGNNKFIHILEGTGVILTDLKDIYWQRKIEGFWEWKPNK